MYICICLIYTICNYVYYLIVHIVFWSISSGYCCSEALCKTWSDYFGDFDGCRSFGAVDRVSTKYLSFIPFLGLSNFYKDNKFDGSCELINALMTVISILAACYCHHRGTNCVVGYIIIFTVILDIIKVVYMIGMGSPDICEIIIIVVSIALICRYCYLDCTGGTCGITPALLITVATVVLETSRDIYTAAYYDKDGNDCPFI